MVSNDGGMMVSCGGVALAMMVELTVAVAAAMIVATMVVMRAFPMRVM